MDKNLTKNAIRRMMDGDKVDLPVLQLITATASSHEFLQLSDGSHHFSRFRICSEITERCKAQLVNYRLVCIENYQLESDGTEMVIIIRKMSILNILLDSIIGVPESWERFKKDELRRKMNSIRVPVNDISPYYMKRLTIIGRVCFLGPVEVISTMDRDYRIMNFHLMDSSSTIACAVFDDVIELFSDKIKINAIVEMTDFKIKDANLAYSKTHHLHELVLSKNTIIHTPNTEDCKHIPKIEFTFIDIQQITSDLIDCTIDLEGIIEQCDKVAVVGTRIDGTGLSKRDVIITNGLGHKIKLTLFDTQAVNFPENSENSRIVLKGVIVKVYEHNVILRASKTSLILISPEFI